MQDDIGLYESPNDACSSDTKDFWTDVHLTFLSQNRCSKISINCSSHVMEHPVYSLYGNISSALEFEKSAYRSGYKVLVTNSVLWVGKWYSL